MDVQIHVGDCRQVLRTMGENSVDSVVTDPPYELGFMGKSWDKTGVAFDPETWRLVMRVLKPGGHLLAFAGSRTYHRIACAIEDAGFEIRDQIMWLYGSGFPKSKNLEGDREGWGTGLKPAHEPIVVARKPLIGTVEENVQKHGTGALNIDGCRIPTGGEELNEGAGAIPCRHDERYARNCSGDRGHSGTRDESGEGATNMHMGGGSANELGRWPANVIHDGSDEVVERFPSEAGAFAPVRGTEPSNQTSSVYGQIDRKLAGQFHGDSGSAARFFYCAKVSRFERNAGLVGMDEKPLNWSSGEQSPGTFQSEGTHKAAKNYHPTVKPIDLMRYLCKLITPPGGVVFDPFMGSGSTGCAALHEGFQFVGVELNEEYASIAKARIEYWRGHQPELFV